jgi:hypothetical protein
MNPEELEALNFRGLGKIAAIPAASLLVKLEASLPYQYWVAACAP